MPVAPRTIATTTALVGVALGVSTGCVQDHDQLAEKGGSGGMRFGTGGRSADGGPRPDGAPPEASGGAGGALKPGDDEPAGPLKLTLLHGVIDSPWIAFCFARARDGAAERMVGSPVPEGGLAYGHAAVLDAIPKLDLAADGVHPYVVAAASADVVAGLDCSEILSRSAAPSAPDAAATDADVTTVMDASLPAPAADAAPADAAREDAAPRDAALDVDSSPPVPPVPELRVAPLPVLNAGTFTRPRSYLLVASGCVGGPGITDPSQASICGARYTPATPTLSESFVQLSRIVSDDSVGLQYLGGTPAVAVSDLSLIPGLSGDPVRIVSSVVPGQIRPVPPNARNDSADIAPHTDRAAIQIFSAGTREAVYSEPWDATLEAAALDDLENGAAYTLVLIGPFPTFTKSHWWNAPLVAIVKN